MDRFSDLMVKDKVTGECFRADHLLKDHLEQLTSDPKCTPEKAKEYAEVITKVIATPSHAHLPHYQVIFSLPDRQLLTI